MKDDPVKTINLNYKITEPIDTEPVQYQSSSKKYISFTDAQIKAEFFLKSYKLLSFRQLYAYIYNCYREARLSRKKIDLAEDISDSIIREDVDRCLKNFEVRGLISYTTDGKFCYDPNCDVKKLAENGRVSPLSQLVIWFHIFNSKKIGMEYIVINDQLSSEFLQYKIENTIYSVSPLPWPGLYNFENQDDEISYCIEKAKKIMNINKPEEDIDGVHERSCEKDIFIVSGNKIVYLFLKDSENEEEKWFDHGTLAVCDLNTIQSSSFDPKFKIHDLKKLVKAIRDKKS